MRWTLFLLSGAGLILLGAFLFSSLVPAPGSGPTPEAPPPGESDGGEAPSSDPSPKPAPRCDFALPLPLETTWRDRVYRVPDSSEQKRIVQTLVRAWPALRSGEGRAFARAGEELSESGYGLIRCRLDDLELAVLRPSGDHAGAGIFLFRTGSLPMEAFLQAPHAMIDRRTEQIAQEVFRRHPFRGVFLSDWTRLDDSTFEGSDWDVTRQPSSLLHLLTLALSEIERGSVWIQIHGFNPTAVGLKEVDLVLSPGWSQKGMVLPARFERFSDRLKGVFSPGRVRVFPKETRLLGGVNNLQALALHESGRDFIQIELSTPFREGLERTERLNLFANALWAGLSP